MQQVEAQAAGGDPELRERVEARLGRAPVVAVRPVVAERLHARERDALAVVADRLALRPARRAQPGAQILEVGLGDGDPEGLYGSGRVDADDLPELRAGLVLALPDVLPAGEALGRRLAAGRADRALVGHRRSITAGPRGVAGADGGRDALPPRAQHADGAARRRRPGCRGCDLYRPATQTVFGEGREGGAADARRRGARRPRGPGRPAVRRAGRARARPGARRPGIDREDAYVTNAVKHFKFEERGKRRIHEKPSRSEVKACLPWLREELRVVEPEALVLLGATAAQALLGASFRLTRERGARSSATSPRS